jgi:hypothetical protein
MMMTPQHLLTWNFYDLGAHVGQAAGLMEFDGMPSEAAFFILFDCYELPDEFDIGHKQRSTRCLIEREHDFADF